MTTVWDSHVHIFPDRMLQSIWKWFAAAGWRLPCSGLDSEALYASLENSGVEQAFLLPYAHKPGISHALNEWIRDFCHNRPCLIPFACVHPADQDVEAVLRTALDEWGFAGIKIHLAVLGHCADDPMLFPVYRAALQRDKPVVIHAGTAPYPPHCSEYSYLGLDRLRPVLEALPGLKLVVPHLGLNELDKAASLLETYPGIHLDTSWALGNPNLQLDTFRLKDIFQAYPDRILYGSDFPIIEHSPQEGLRALLDLDLPSAALERILWRNAQRLVGGSGSEKQQNATKSA